MCVLYLAFGVDSESPLIILANRDEFYDRPTLPAAFWEDQPDIFGGRDLKAGGTWLGVSRGGRFAAVTNYRDRSAPTGSRSRGELVTQFLLTTQRADEYLDELRNRSNEYSGFNLIAGEVSRSISQIAWYSNRSNDVRPVSPGIYGLSNHLLDTPWPKVVQGKLRFAELLQSGKRSNKDFFDLLSDKSLAADGDLPSTGIPYEAEKAVSAVFIKTPDYGTRCSTVLRFDRNLEWSCEERVFA